MTSEPAKARPGDPLAGLPLLIAVPEAAKLLGIRRAAAYRFARAGDLPTKRLGRRVYLVLDPFTLAALTAHVETLDRERQDLGPAGPCPTGHAPDTAWRT